MRVFGEHEGRPVHEAMLRSDAGVEVSLLSYGALVRDWRVPDRSERPRTVTLGFDTFEPYPQHSRSFGIIAGRVANRVRDGRFTLGGQAYQLDRNDGANHLHGGSVGLGRRVWTMEADDAHARLTINSADGEMGYPGKVRFTVEVRLEGFALSFTMRGEPDRATPIALAQHSYYALGGDPRAHELTVAAHRITATDERNVATGEIVEVDGTRYDFRSPRPVGSGKIDINYCLDRGDPAAVLLGEAMRLTLATDRPGLQVYNAHDMPIIPVPGLGGARYAPYAGIALEAQDWPDALNNAHFPNIVATPDAPYEQRTTVTIVPREA